MLAEDQSPFLYKTFSFRVKDRRAGRRSLAPKGRAVNTVWNYCNEISRRSAERGKKWVGKQELRALTKGAGRELGLPSQVVQEVIDQFLKSRRQSGRPRLRWRVSRGPRRSLGWIPFTNQDVAVLGDAVLLRGERFRIWKHRDIPGRIKCGSFSEDARGRWYVNLVVEVPRPAATNRTRIVGYDLGHRTVATGFNAPDLEQARFYRGDMEARIAEAQRRGRRRHARTLAAKVKNRRKDLLHKFARAAVDNAGAIFVGNVSASWQARSGRGKAVHDQGWSMLRNLFSYKCDHAGVAFAEVDERHTTQLCSGCGALGGPQGREELGVRRWVCDACGAVHDRDRNAAVNIARLGCETLGLKWPGSPSFGTEQPSLH